MILEIIYSVLLIYFSIYCISNTLEDKIINNKTYMFSNNCILMFLVGILLTSITQSSTAITALTISLLNSKKISLKPSVCLVLGSNIGTSFTSFFTGLNFSNYFLLFIIGFILFNIRTIKSYGIVIIYISFLFLGLNGLKEALIPLKNSINLIKYFKHFNNNSIISLLGGLITTFILQSSSTIIALTQQIASINIISLKTSFLIVLGSNIGSTISGLILSLTMNKQSKLLAVSNLVVNTVGALVFIPIVSVLNIYIHSKAITISIFQIFFNVVCGVFGLIFINPLVNFSYIFINKKTV